MKTVLVVDDVPANVDVVLGFLAEAGYRVLVSESGNRALEQLTLALPDIILLDFMMLDWTASKRAGGSRRTPNGAISRLS